MLRRLCLAQRVCAPRVRAAVLMRRRALPLATGHASLLRRAVSTSAARPVTTVAPAAAPTAADTGARATASATPTGTPTASSSSGAGVGAAAGAPTPGGGAGSALPNAAAEQRYRHALLDSMLRVDHAGEYGAVRILDGQLAVLGRAALNGTRGHAQTRASNAAGQSTVAPVLEEMRAQEQQHLNALAALMPAEGARPSLLLPVWHAAGFALGAGSALLGVKSAMAVTVAVEEVITEHYNDQLRQLSADPNVHADPRYAHVRQLIRKHRDEEEGHRDTGVAHDAQQAPLYAALTAVVKTGCYAAIWLAKRV